LIYFFNLIFSSIRVNKVVIVVVVVVLLPNIELFLHEAEQNIVICQWRAGQIIDLQDTDYDK